MTEEKKQLPSLAVQSGTGLIINNLDEVSRVAKLFVASGMFQEKDAEKDIARAAVKVIAGQEMGLTPFQSMRGLDVIQGVVSFRYQLVAAKIKQSGKYDFKPLVSNDKEAQIQFYEDGKPTWISKYTMEQAVRAGLAQKDGWKKNPEDMLYARALTKGANKVCPELFFGGVVSPEDLGVDADVVIEANAAGETVEVKTEVATAPPPKKSAGKKQQEQKSTPAQEAASESVTVASSSESTTTESAEPVESESSATATETDADIAEATEIIADAVPEDAF